MNKSFFGIPVVLVLFVIVILAPLLVADYMLMQKISKVEVAKPVVVEVAPTVAPTATPSATLAPTKSLAPVRSFAPVKPTAAVK